MTTVKKVLQNFEQIRQNCAKRRGKNVYYEIVDKTFSLYESETKNLIFIIGVDKSTYGEDCCCFD